MRGQAHSEEMVQNVKKMYEAGVTYDEISRRLNVSKGSINCLLERAGVELTRGTKKAKVKTCSACGHKTSSEIAVYCEVCGALLMNKDIALGELQTLESYVSSVLPEKQEKFKQRIENVRRYIESL